MFYFIRQAVLINMHYLICTYAANVRYINVQKNLIEINLWI